ncbi:2-phosphosulfolactate phosphatase [Virgibacillus sp. SK37]|uniref:2-phosphosulfolactate phosphatase n=1 Tax=Virgibacillus sp. SK37 TaxID=403957 RepID=UPI0004D10AC4|nr:2-phosphosulfolactate phosphatase [Virgibacillus sp. SK37]AIF44916.1 2-phosphosulfolactate phosphatase [Virgibacillus sp. SK37]
MKVHLLWKKEEIDPSQITEDKLAVLFDVLLATSTITTCLAYGANQVIPFMNAQEAHAAKEGWNDQNDICIAGEYNGQTLSGMLAPTPLALRDQVKEKTVLLSTTNGTVAIRKAAQANKVYIASLLNSKAVADAVIQKYNGETILVICSGSGDQFNMEDFYGAGCFIHQLVTAAEEAVDLSDSALAASIFYQNTSNQAESILSAAKVGRKMLAYGLGDDLHYISQINFLDVVPQLVGRERIKLR